MTEYIVFRAATLAGTGGTNDGYEEIGRAEERSANAAIRAVLARKSETADGVEHVATPVRSWKPVTVKVETKTALKFS